MSKGYKPEYIKKVKEKFNDLQPNSKPNKSTSANTSNDKRCEIRNTSRVVKLG